MTDNILRDQFQEEKNQELNNGEVIRRLRVLGQPAILFAEDDKSRAKRLQNIEKDYQVDDTRESQQGNIYQQLKKEELEKQQQKKKQQIDEQMKPKIDQEQQYDKKVVKNENGTELDQAFQQAAAKLKEKIEEDKMCVEDRILKQLQRWMQEWESDLNARPKEVLETPTAVRASNMYKETEKYFKTFLYPQLQRRSLLDEIRSGIWLIVQACQQRNYQHAGEIFLGLAIGNNPWPIGVTSVGIHERSAREKISYSMNGQAHVMNDEATRKYLQGIKRLVTQIQRLYPAHPSRSMDFNGIPDEGRGVKGFGSEKLALLQAEANGELNYQHEANHYMHNDGTVRVPPKWDHRLKKAQMAINDVGNFKQEEKKNQLVVK